MPRFAANLSMMYGEHAFLDRFAAARADGFDAVEYLFPYDFPAAEIAALWAEAGVQPTDPTIFYCGTGWRASVAFFYAWVMGWDHIRVYDGGWLAWSSDPANPVELRSRTAAPDGVPSPAA